LKAASAADKDVVIETKWMPLLRTASNIHKTIDNRLRYLEGYTISNYMVHQPWSFSTPEAEMDAMADLVEAGKIKSVGVSNFNADRMKRAYNALSKRGLPLVLNQMRYSLNHREIETDGTLAAAKELGITIVAYTPLGSGILTGKYHKNPELIQNKNVYYRGTLKRELEQTRLLINVMEEIAANHNATLAQVALNWVIHFNGDCVVTIPGATKVRQAEESAAAMNFVLSADELARLDEPSRNLK
jgi:aryl-alcohol dehydrogenase-like predicted oxidoreductase